MDVTNVLVVGGSPEASSPELVAELAARISNAQGCRAVVVAVDRGLDFVVAAGLSCDLFVGDVDSVSGAGAALVRACEAGEEGPVREVVRLNPHKDDTDLGLALRAIEERWRWANLTCTCLTGGRPDHALAVFGRLATWEPGFVEIVEDGFSASILHAPSVSLITDSAGKTFSFVPLSPSAIVSEAGMRWNLDNREVELLSDLGLSNVIESDRASFSCHDGVVATWLFD